MTDDSENINVAYVLLFSATAALGGLLFGFDIAIITGAGPFLIQHLRLDDLSLGWAFSSLLFGCVIGSILAGTNHRSRRTPKALAVGSGPVALTSVATGLAASFAIFVVARFLGGLAVGGCIHPGPDERRRIVPGGRAGSACARSTSCPLPRGVLVSDLIDYCCATPETGTGAGCS